MSEEAAPEIDEDTRLLLERRCTELDENLGQVKTGEQIKTKILSRK